MSDHEDIPLFHLSREELQDLIHDMDLNIAVDDLMKAIQLLKDAGDLDHVREAIEQLSKAA